MIDKLQAHYGFTRMPFGRDLAPGMLHRHAAHNEAVARITWCITGIGKQRYQNLLNAPLRETCAA
jgi:type II secretory pathway predicted ATPase ExeA